MTSPLKCNSCWVEIARGGQEGQCRECRLEDRIRELEQKAVGWQVEETIEDRIRALEHKAVGWQVIGEKVMEIEGRVEKGQAGASRARNSAGGTLLSSMEASLDKMANLRLR